MLHTANTKRMTSAKPNRQYLDPQKYGIIKGTRVLHFNNLAENKCSKSVHDASAKLRTSLVRHFSRRSDGCMLHTANTKMMTSAKCNRQYRDPQKYGIIKGTWVFNNLAENKCSKSVHEASAKLRTSLVRHFSRRSDAV